MFMMDSRFPEKPGTAASSNCAHMRRRTHVPSIKTRMDTKTFLLVRGITSTFVDTSRVIGHGLAVNQKGPKSKGITSHPCRDKIQAQLGNICQLEVKTQKKNTVY